MNQDFTFPKGSKIKSSSDPCEDSFVQEYFKNPSANLYLKKLLNNDKSYLTNGDYEKLKESYDKAHDIRKFEIELYWKRTTYVWTLISALIAVCGVLLAAYYRASPPAAEDKSLLIIVGVIAAIGVFITIISSRILKSGEYWKENWEYHVNMLEPLFSGRLYATLINTEKVRYSISSLNHSVYYFFLAAWLLLAEGIYIAFAKPSDLVDLLIPLGAYSFFVIAIIIRIDQKTKRETKTVAAHISQWDIEIMSDQIEQDKKRKKSSLYKKLSLVKTILWIILLVFWIAISASILFFLFTR
ncbi:MAG: hypothetical protein E6663_03195 [Staphylococcus lugdunensis]|nr:hypothetical protein [Staphylococcus lugdunensis]